MLVSIIIIVVIMGLVLLTVGVLKSVNFVVIMGIDLTMLGTIAGIALFVYRLIKGG